MTKDRGEKQLKETDSVAIFTIVSKNYISAARILMRGLKLHHPDAKRYVILCDRIEDNELINDDFDLIEVEDIGIPLLKTMISAYTIMELNTAIKPFCFRYLFTEGRFEKVVYLDPDIMMLQPMYEVISSLGRCDAVLTPHIQTPFNDSNFPSDLSILQSGTYNFGFVGFARTSKVERFISWWEEKLFIDCVVDIQNGLFVDQKWCDMLPGFFDCHVIRDPGYNVAYWNLHERQLRKVDGKYFCGENPLTFFHFSGYNPLRRDVLSKHQNRHKFPFSVALQDLLDEYSGLLLSDGYIETSQLKYSFRMLGDFIPNNQIINWVVRYAYKNRITLPDPWLEPSEFSSKIAEADLSRSDAVPLLSKAILYKRPDVAAAFPAAAHDPYDQGFSTWLNNNGFKELGLGSLKDKTIRPKNSTENDISIYSVVKVLIDAGRTDVLSAYRDMFLDQDIYLGFTEWVEKSAPNECGAPPDLHLELVGLFQSPARILHLYLQRPDLVSAFPKLWVAEQAEEFCNWLRRNRSVLNVSVSQIDLFACFLRLEKNLVTYLCWRYVFSKGGSGDTIYNFATKNDLLKPEFKSQIINELIERFNVDLRRQALDFLALFRSHNTTADPLLIFAKVQDVSDHIGTTYMRLYETLMHAAGDISPSRPGIKKINVAGYFHSSTGMGESARSMLRMLNAGDFDIRWNVLPDYSGYEKQIPCVNLFGDSHPFPDVSIIVANADSAAKINSFLPSWFHGNRKIGYLVWETNELPDHYRDLEEIYSEIWSPSTASSKAISIGLNLPIRTVPHTIEVTKIATEPSPAVKGGNALKVGFMFDCKSVLERKNPAAVVDAVEQARASGAEVVLFIKVSGRDEFDFNSERMIAMLSRPFVTIIDTQMDKTEVYRFISDLDVYISLHRFEGFGLTMAEAMALGKVVIGTNYSGNCDFMDSDNSILISAELYATPSQYGPYPKGSIWADPDVDEAAQWLVKLSDPNLRQQFGENGSRFVQDNLSAGSVLRRSNIEL